MIHTIYSQKDATIYSKTASLNTGLDQILELSRAVESTSSVHTSRILMKFDLAAVSASIVAGNIATSSRYYAVLSTLDATELQDPFTLNAFPISESWDSGTGKKHHEPITSDGVTWQHRTKTLLNTKSWATSSWNVGVTGSYYSSSMASSSRGGGTWYTGSGYVASQSFNLSSTTLDTKIDITDMVNKWLNGTIPNEGFILMRSGSEEFSLTRNSSIKYFSGNSHTIYIPKLQIAWDDSTFTTGSLSAQTNEDIILYTKNLNKHIKIDSKVKIRVRGRERFPTITYSTGSNYLDIKYLPTSSYYSVKDVVTDETVIDFDDNYTKLSSDASGNFFNFWASGFQPERYYKFVFKVKRLNPDTTEYFDNNYSFKVVR